MQQHRAALALFLITVLVGAVIGIAVPRATAQMPDDWTRPYIPALLPAFAGDMAANADAPTYKIDLALEVTPNEAVVTGHQAVTFTNRLPSRMVEICGLAPCRWTIRQSSQSWTAHVLS
jgi:hypothetical protein